MKNAKSDYTKNIETLVGIALVVDIIVYALKLPLANIYVFFNTVVGVLAAWIFIKLAHFENKESKFKYWINGVLVVSAFFLNYIILLIGAAIVGFLYGLSNKK